MLTNQRPLTTTFRCVPCSLARLALPIMLLFVAVATATAENWPAWRGASGNGIGHEKNVPTSWSAEKNIRWRTPLSSPGNSTPIVWENRVFLTAASEDGAQRSLLCFDRADGKLLWQQHLAAEPNEVTHKTNPYCASSPVTDGKTIVVWQGSAGAAAYDFAGKQLWHKDLGKFTHAWGYASSPVIVGNRVIISCGPGLRAFLVALDLKSGREVWRRELPTAQSEKAKDFHGSWSTPLIVEAGGRRQLILSLPHDLRAFDVATGDDVWVCQGLSRLSYTSPIIGRTADGTQVVVAMSGYTGPALACRTGGKGDVTATHRLWLHETKNPQRIGSGVIVGGHIYLLNESGVAWCMQLGSGELLWKERLGGKSWSSMTLIDGKIYVLNMKGETHILRPDTTKLDLVTTNPLAGELTRGSHAFSDGQIFVRSYKHLTCIEETGK